ncbi:MAG TPA: MlaD family protein [Solirubrobacterales bacterium]|nr:MlaD family protein [Solirubrobacterales bacterium]
MQKSAPSIGRILIAVGFALSCFLLLLFLWISFGGPVPLKAESYRITAYFPEATQLAQESDVRIGGVSVGKVKSVELAPIDKQIDGQDTSEVEIEIEPEFAPISSDARAILRLKTLLGETYVELTSGTDPDSAAGVSLGSAAPPAGAGSEELHSIPEGGSLGLARIHNQTQIDEIFNALDDETRSAFQQWQQGAAVAIRGRSLDLNDAVGNLAPFFADASDVLAVLRRQRDQLQGLVRDTGTVFDALSERDGQLADAITGSNATFEALASEEQALRDFFQIAPTFENEARLTFERLDRFQADTTPLVRKLLPVANDISPTLRSVRRLSPRLRSLFLDLDDLNRASRRGFPALASTLRELRPTLENLDPFLANLNPVVAWLEHYRFNVTDFLSNPPVGLAGQIAPQPGQPAPRHALRQLGYVSQEGLSIYRNRLPENRGNGYLMPYQSIIRQGDAAQFGIFPNWDCDNTGGGERFMNDGGFPTVSTYDDPTPPGPIPGTQSAFAPCFVAPDYGARWGGTHFPRVRRDR